MNQRDNESDLIDGVTYSGSTKRLFDEDPFGKGEYDGITLEHGTPSRPSLVSFTGPEGITHYSTRIP